MKKNNAIVVAILLLCTLLTTKYNDSIVNLFTVGSINDSSTGHYVNTIYKRKFIWYDEKAEIDALITDDYYEDGPIITKELFDFAPKGVKYTGTITKSMGIKVQIGTSRSYTVDSKVGISIADIKASINEATSYTLALSLEKSKTESLEFSVEVPADSFVTLCQTERRISRTGTIDGTKTYYKAEGLHFEISNVKWNFDRETELKGTLYEQQETVYGITNKIS